MRKHAVLSASSAHRWLVCTPSARMEEKLPDATSESAEEGTLAHAIAELKLRNMAINPIPKRAFNAKMKSMKESPLYQKEMDLYTDEYIDYIRGVMLLSPEKPLVRAEMRVDFSKYVPEGFGTSDCVLIFSKELHIVDFKYGKNVPVSAVDNPQLKLYALGAIDEFALFYDIERVFLHIFQPRSFEKAEATWEISSKKLKLWGEEIKDKVILAFEGKGEQVIGTHCTFCRAKGICRKQAEQNLALAQYEFKMPPIISHAEVGDILFKAKDLASWVKKLEEWALTEVLTGAEVPGWKAVEGRGSRAFADQDEAFKKLIENGVAEELLYERKPLTLSQIEKELGKKDFTAFVGDMVIKAPGKPTLVDESDKRNAITKINAQEDFKDE